MKRVKRRYLALKIDSNENFSQKEIVDAIWNAVLKLFGEYGASQTGLRLIDYDAEKKTAIIYTVHTSLTMVRAAIATIIQIGNKPLALHVTAVSGTIKTLRKKLKANICEQ
ncbi:MAG: Rpp14/Pop5 family protein [Candidatus Bathyarchaeia archaeon]